MTFPIELDNCQICGQERLNIELISVKLGERGFSKIKSCLSCLVKHHKTGLKDYHNSADTIIEALKNKIEL